jgi:uncharacterized membrane protein YeaQ/YmgE (transglycosylase-associated protein family)
MINFSIWIIIGGLLGWIATLMMRTNAYPVVFVNVLVGIMGAFIAGMFLTPLFGVDTINHDDFSTGAMLVSFLGGIIMLAVLGLFRRRAVR